MGVACTAYKRVVLIEAGSSEQLGGWDRIEDEEIKHGWRYLYNVGPFADRSDGLPDGLYDVSGESIRVEHSYGGYNHFRDEVCKAALGVEPRAVWEDPNRYKDEPFFEWVHFADNEGLLGPKTCVKLADDFERMRDTVTSKMQDEYDRGRYDEWVEAMRLAASGEGAMSYT